VKEPEFLTKAAEEGEPELLEELELPTEELAGKIEEKEGFLSNEGEKLLLPRDRREL
jgi:hypothetical protein